MIAAICRSIQHNRHVAVGASSPIPAAAALLAQSINPHMRVSILGSEEDNPFTDGGRELFDCAAQGRIDTFFFSGVQIDAHGNANLLGIGKMPQMRRRFIGNFGAPYLATIVPNIILFRTDHSVKSLVERVDFISAPGRNVRLLVTDKAVLSRLGGRFQLVSVHPGLQANDIAAMTGFALDIDHEVPETAPLTPAQAGNLDDAIMPRMQRLYPAFVSMMSRET